MSEHDAMAAMRAKHPDWIWNRSDNHVILGVPRSLEGLKTVVEPGNCFSPGVGSFGVSTWVFDRAQGTLHAPETKDLSEIAWRFLGGRFPVLISSWRAGPLAITSRLFTDRADRAEAAEDVNDYMGIVCKNESDSNARATLYIVIRSFGPAGGGVRALASEDAGCSVTVNGTVALCAEPAPTGFGAVSYEKTSQDISELLRTGTLPEDPAVEDASSWASGAIASEIELEPGQTYECSFMCGVRGADRHIEGARPLDDEVRFNDRESAFAESWKAQLDIELDLPDERYADALAAQLMHLSMFTVYDTPRISPISYPIFWLRDGSYAVTALDRGGFHEFAAAACRRVMHLDAFGGFGSEGDGPGQLVWMLSEHYLLTRDDAYLEEVYPHLMRLGQLIAEMRHTDRPLRRYTEFVMPEQTLAVENDLMCLTPENGLISGRMDHGIRHYWCSSWGYLGLERAAMCARALGRETDATRLETERDELLQALCRNAPHLFGHNERDYNCALWPSTWALHSKDLVRERYTEYWDTERCPGGKHRPEPLWTYFEAGQAHNYMLLGEREKAWVSIEHFLSHHIAPGLYTYHEGDGDENSFNLWQRVRGWDRIKYVTPHGWTGAELFHLLRDGLVYEDGEDLVIGAGVPQVWVDAGRPFGVSRMPTHFGSVSWEYDPRSGKLQTDIERPFTGTIRNAIPSAESSAS